MSPMKTVFAMLMVAALFAFPASAGAVSYTFDDITNNNASNAAAGESQLKLDVTSSVSGTQILFKFTNVGPLASSITDIYFDDNVPRLSYNMFIQSTGVSFTVGASPPDLPAGTARPITSAQIIHTTR